jgi:hypothetical protein
MAFNPFNVFRRNQRILFALLTIMVMFMFVLSSGLGGSDFFQWFPEWLGRQKGGRGETVAVVDGRKLTTGQLAELSQTRVKANEFMNVMAMRASENIAKTIDDATNKADRESSQMLLRNMLQSRQGGYLSMQDQQQFMMAQFQGQQISPTQIINARITEIGRQNQMLTGMVAAAGTKPEDKELAQYAKALINLDATRMFSPTYFGTVPIGETRNSYEFELWKRKADKLGITISPADAEQMVYTELLGKVSETDWKEVLRDLQGRESRFTGPALKQMLADEFRVRLAQTAVIGNLGGRGDTSLIANQSAASPYEVFQFYRQQCDEAVYAVVSVPVDNYLAEVKGEPTEAELRELFAKHRVQEPNPTLERPGFKEPRKLKLEWLQAKGDEPFYQNAAKEALPKAELQARLSGLLASPIGPSGVLPVIAGPALLSIKPESVLASAYESYKFGADFNIRSGWDLGFFPSRPDVTDEHSYRPQNLASLAGVMAGSLMGFGPPSAGPIVMLERARIEERNAKARAQAALFLVPVPGSVGPLGGAIALLARMPQPLPLAVLKPEAEKKVRDRLARQICYNDLTKFQTEMANLGKGIDKSSARDYLDKFVKERGFTRGESKEFRDTFAMSSDPGLAPLVDIFKKRVGDKANLAFFGNSFFFDSDFRGQQRSATTYYAPDSYPPRSLDEQSFVGSQLADAPTEPALLVWRTAEEPALEPKNYDDPKVRAKVVAAWKRIKAREIAKAKADELAKQAGTFGTNPEVIRGKLIDAQAAMKAAQTDKAAMDRIRYFEFDKVAPLVGGQMFQPGRAPVESFRVLPDERIPYPTADMTTELIKNREKDVPTAVVLADQPKDNYYVAVLTQKFDRKPYEFGLGIYAPSRTPGGDIGDAVRNLFESDATRKAREMAINLLKAEFKVENENEKLLSEKSDSGS